MALKLIYQMFAKLLSWRVLRARSDAANEIEILVLRQQLAVLQRRRPRPRISWTDRTVIAALARLLPACRRRGLLVTPSTILRWHRHLVRRRWTTPYTRPARPAVPAGVRALVLRLQPRIRPGVSPHPRRIRRTRLPDRRLDRMEDTAQRRDRSRAATGGTNLVAVPPRASQGVGKVAVSGR